MFSIVQRLRDRRDSEEGFTLIELMVVVMIIAILMAIAIPAFLGARKRAQDSSAKSAVRNSLSEAQVVFSDLQSYPASATLATTLAAEEPNFTFSDTVASTGPKEISVEVNAAGTEVILGARSQAGNCIFLKHASTGGGISQAIVAGASCDSGAIPVGTTFTAL